MAVHQVLHQFQVGPALGRRHDELRLEQFIQAEQRRRAPQFVAHQFVRLLGTGGLERCLESHIKQVKRGMAGEQALDQHQALFHAAQGAKAFNQALRHQREIGGCLLFDALPCKHRLLVFARGRVQIAQLHVGPDALAARGKRLIEVGARLLGARVRRLDGGELAVKIGDLLLQ